MDVQRSGLSADVVAKLTRVFALYPQIAKVILYGSRAKGTYRLGSDIDLTVVRDAKEAMDQVHLSSQIDDLNLPYKIDLSMMDEIENPDLIDHIRRVGVVFYSRSK